MTDELRPCPYCGAPNYYLCHCDVEDYIDEITNLRAKLDEWKAAHDNLARQLSVANDNLEVAVDGIMWIRDLFVENGEYNEATEKVNEILKRLEG